MSNDIIRIRRGQKETMPELSVGEIGFTLDTEQLFVGGLNKNKEFHSRDYVDAQLAESAKDNAIVLRPTGSDDTSLINDAINTVITDARLKKVILNGEFTVKATGNYKPAIAMKSNVVLEFTPGSKLILTPNAYEGYEIISCRDINNFKIINPYLVGDLDNHLGTTGSSGWGIFIAGSSNFEIIDAYIEQCWGDGFYIKNSYIDNSISENGYINRIKIVRCRRNGFVISSARNLTVDYIECHDITLMAPRASIDIETHLEGEVLDNVNIGEIKSFNCTGGALIQPLGMSNESESKNISVRIDKLSLFNGSGECGRLSFDMVDPDKVKGNVYLGDVYIEESIRPLVLKNILNGGVEIYINNLKMKSITNGGSLNSDAAIYFEMLPALRSTKNIGKIIINNIDLDCQSRYFMSLIGQSSGTIEKSNIKINNTVNLIDKPMRLDGQFDEITGEKPINSVNIEKLSEIYNPGQKWFSNQFNSNIYHNEGSIDERIVTPSGGNIYMKNTPITLENKSVGFGIDLTGKTIHPQSLGFINGFKTSELGAKITFIQKKDGTIFILNLIGEWVTR